MSDRFYCGDSKCVECISALNAELLEVLETLERAHMKGFIDLKHFKMRTHKAITRAKVDPNTCR